MRSKIQDIDMYVIIPNPNVQSQNDLFYTQSSSNERSTLGAGYFFLIGVAPASLCCEREHCISL